MAKQDAGIDLSTEKRSALLSGLGFYRLSVQRRKQLTYVFMGSLAAHILGLIAFGGWIVMRQHKEDVTIFETQPPRRTYEPRKLEHKVRLQKRQRSSSRPSMVPRLVSMKMSQVALPEIKMDPKLIHTTFQPKFKPVSGKGLGAGLGTGYGTHGFGNGVSSYDFFGIRARGEKIAVLVDVSVSMVEEERGGPKGYNAVKRRLGQVADALADTCLFNVLVYADACSVMDKELVLADSAHRTKAKMFLRPYNTAGNWGLDQGNYQPKGEGLKAHGGTTRLDLPLTAAFEMGADTILIISDGIPRVQKGFSNDQLRAMQQKRQAWHAENAGAVGDWDARWGGGGGVVERVWVPDPNAAKKGPPKEGQKQSAGGHWKVTRAAGWHPRPQPPKMPEPGFWTLADFIQHLDVLYEKYYVKKGQPKPVIHCIGYAIDKEGHAFLRGLARHYHGQYRRVTKIR